MITKKPTFATATAGEATKEKVKISRSFTGVVTSDSMTKTITVLVKTVKTHPKYKKKYIVTDKYHVHDEKSTAKVGDTVSFVECRPLSATKRWRLVEILKKNA